MSGLTKEPVIEARDRLQLETELKAGMLLGSKGLDKQIYLYASNRITCVLEEIGRLREQTFRCIGLGTGKDCDLDQYDISYDHLVLWDDQAKEIVGSYRLKPCAEAKSLPGNETGLYTQSIYQLSDKFIQEYFVETVEIGRVFIQEKYWGTRSLDYLWYGMAYYFELKPHLRYFICALSIPPNFSPYAKQIMVDFYTRHFGNDETLATALYPYTGCVNTATFFEKLAGIFQTRAKFKFLKTYVAELGFKFPMLYKNTEIFHRDGVKFISFGYDKGFSDALDGLMFADTHRMRVKTKSRYTDSLPIAETLAEHEYADESDIKTTV